MKRPLLGVEAASSTGRPSGSSHRERAAMRSASSRIGIGLFRSLILAIHLDELGGLRFRLPLVWLKVCRVVREVMIATSVKMPYLDANNLQTLITQKASRNKDQLRKVIAHRDLSMKLQAFVEQGDKQQKDQQVDLSEDIRNVTDKLAALTLSNG